MNVRHIFLLAVALLLMSCQNDLTNQESDTDIINQKSYPNVDQELWPYFESFENEAALRGINANLALDRIVGSIENISQSDVVGQCSYGGNARSHVRVDQNFWTRASIYGREMIVFHELGHCFLYRDHREGRFEDGSCVSIMRSGLAACRDNYFSGTREYYIDELFSEFNR